MQVAAIVYNSNPILPLSSRTAGCWSVWNMSMGAIHRLLAHWTSRQCFIYHQSACGSDWSCLSWRNSIWGMQVPGYLISGVTHADLCATVCNVVNFNVLCDEYRFWPPVLDNKPLSGNWICATSNKQYISWCQNMYTYLTSLELCHLE